MLDIFLVDDEPLGLENLEFLLSQFPDVAIKLKTTNPFEALTQAVRQPPDLIFLDISMPGMSGLAFAEKLCEAQSPSKIVFATAYDNFAIDAYAYNTIDYILKPVTYDKLRRLFRKLEKNASGEAQMRRTARSNAVSRFMGFNANRYHAIAPENAQYIYTSNRKTLLVANGQEYELKNNIGYWTEKLRLQGWFRCHRNYLINLSQIDMVEPMSNSVYFVTMKNCSAKVIVSRQYSTIFRSLFEL